LVADTQVQIEEKEIIEWHALTSDPRWELVMQASGKNLAQAHADCANRKLLESDRLYAMGLVEAWSAIRNWQELYRDAYERLAAAETGDTDEELVGAKLEDQWHQKT